MQPILSICIPTYNRANWLRSSLWNWLPQVNDTNGLVELIICDNDSSDHTKKVIEEARSWGDFQYYCNPENIGAIRNIYRLVDELAHSEFVWIVGDDDLPNLDVLPKVIDTISKCSTDIKYIYVNHSYWTPSKSITNDILKSKDLDFSQYGCLDFETRFVNQISELVSINFNCFTPIYNSIMRKQVACEAFELGIRDKIYSSVEATVPHAVYIAKNLLNESAWYIGYPCTLASCNTSWSDLSALYVADYLPSVFKMIEENGGARSDIKIHKIKLMEIVPYIIKGFCKSNAPLMDKLYVVLKYCENYPILSVLWNESKSLFVILRMQGGKIKILAKKLKLFLS